MQVGRGLTGGTIVLLSRPEKEHRATKLTMQRQQSDLAGPQTATGHTMSFACGDLES